MSATPALRARYLAHIGPTAVDALREAVLLSGRVMAEPHVEPVRIHDQCLGCLGFLREGERGALLPALCPTCSATLDGLGWPGGVR